MVDILPIEKLRDEDVPLFGSGNVNLAKLAQSGIAVEDGVVVTAPDIRLRTLLKYFDLKNKEIFEQSLTVIKSEIKKIEVPSELDGVLSRKKIKSDKIWQELLSIWLEEIRKRVWSEGLSSGVALNLSAQIIFFPKKITASGKSFIDSSKEVVTEVSRGKLDERYNSELKELVVKGDRVLFLPYIYYWVIDSGKLRIVKVRAYTPNPDQEIKVEDWGEMEEKKEPRLKSGVKVFLDISEGMVTKEGIDGVYLQSEKIPNFEEKIFKLVDAATLDPDNTVLFKLSDEIEQKGGVRGTLRLIHQSSLLKKDVEALLFARNKKNLGNVSVVVPYVRSSDEFLQIKRDLAALGVSRKGSLKLWLELCVPENIINLEEYTVAGLDGVVINLDELSSLIGGFDPEVPESVFYSKQIKALLKLLEDKLKYLHSQRIPFLVTGALSLHDEVLAFLISKGVYAIVASLNYAESLDEHLRFMEKRVIRSRVS